MVSTVQNYFNLSLNESSKDIQSLDLSGFVADLRNQNEKIQNLLSKFELPVIEESRVDQIQGFQSFVDKLSDAFLCVSVAAIIVGLAVVSFIQFGEVITASLFLGAFLVGGLVLAVDHNRHLTR